MAPLRVLISGGGVAGPALAFWMTRLGHSCTVIERFPQLRASGQQIDIREQGVDVARRMGVLETIRATAVDEEGLQFVDGSGKQLALFPKVESDSGRQSISSEFEIMRGDLCRILVDASGPKTEYRFGLSVEGFDEGADGVDVRLSDGSTERYDLLVGADGQGSRIRKMMLKDDPEASDTSRNLGVYAGFWSMDRKPTDAGMASVYHAPGKRIMATRWHTEKRGQGYMATMAHTEELDKVLADRDIDDQKALFARIFQGSGWQEDRLTKAMYESDDFYAQALVQIKCTPWAKGRVVLLGDAGYCPSPMTGMGTSLALIGAYVMAGEISRNPNNLGAALQAYEEKLRPFVDSIQKLPPGVPWLVYPETELGVSVLRGCVGLISKLMSLSWLFSWVSLPSREGWKLPEYPELKTK